MNYRVAGEQFAEVLELMARLRGEKGCPWDKQQTHGSLKPFLLEEAHELLDALDARAPAKLSEELGDVLHQIVFHCQIAGELGEFTVMDVLKGLKEKLVRRHPHVFSDESLTDVQAVTQQWARIKARENSDAAVPSALGNLPRSMPALARAQAIGERASRLGFDWPAIDPVWEKISEELKELRAACSADDREEVENEIGDLFFSLVNLARFLGIQAEEALHRATKKFIARFAHIEARVREAGKLPTGCSLQELDALWDEAKALEKKSADPK